MIYNKSIGITNKDIFQENPSIIQEKQSDEQFSPWPIVNKPQLMHLIMHLGKTFTVHQRILVLGGVCFFKRC